MTLAVRSEGGNILLLKITRDDMRNSNIKMKAIYALAVGKASSRWSVLSHCRTGRALLPGRTAAAVVDFCCRREIDSNQGESAVAAVDKKFKQKNFYLMQRLNF